MTKKDNFKDVCDLVESGLTISEALDSLNMTRTAFYKEITKSQKLILNQTKALNTVSGNTSFRESDIKELHEFFTTEEYAY